LNKLYAIYVDAKGIDTPLFVNEKIFEERLKSYFLKTCVSREEILSVKWNMYITRGKYIKIDEFGDVKEFAKDGEEDKFYVSYLEISGPLGSFHSIHKEKELS
jgi:hypothetical protein